jgi:hypothetical protein
MKSGRAPKADEESMAMVCGFGVTIGELSNIPPTCDSEILCSREDLSAGWPVALGILPEGLGTLTFPFPLTIEILRSSSHISVDYQWLHS